MSMNLRHAVALALVGWYLLIPNIDNKGKLGLPFQWTLHRSFDSARECESERDRLKAQFSSRHPELVHLDSAQMVKKVPPTVARWAFPMCIATDDPRLDASRVLKGLGAFMHGGGD